MLQRCFNIAAVAALAAAYFFLPASGLAQTISFAKAVNTTTGGGLPRALAAADFDGDGKIDLAVVNSALATQNVALLRGNGNGTFAPAAVIATLPSAAPVALIAADFDNDGKVDLAVADRNTSVRVFLGNGDGTFDSAIVTSLGFAAFSPSMAVGDFNRDGQLDLAVTLNGQAAAAIKKLAILLGNGDGTFSLSTQDLPRPPTSVTAADFDSDGKLDLAVADASTVLIFPGQGDGTFATSIDIQQNGAPTFVAVGDVNRDGIPDLAIAINSKNVAIRLGTGDLNDADHGFAAPANVGVVNIPQFVLLADFNGDGKLDLAATFLAGSSVSIRPGLGDGHFTGGANVLIKTASFSAVAGDFNGDGRPDVIAANAISTTVSILLNTTLFTFAGDLAAKTDFALSPATAPAGIAAGDFNGDGKLDLAVANLDTNNVSVFLGGDLGSFTLTSQSPFSAGTGAAAVAVADFDRDGIPDLAVVNSGAGTVSIFIGAGDGTFNAAATPTLTVGAAPVAAVTGDWDGDGRQDLAVVNNGDDNVSVLLGNGDGTFDAALTFATAAGPRGIAAGDFNRDGILDLAVAAQTDGKVSILLGVGDGTFAANTDFSVGTGPTSVASGDFNRDGALDLAVANGGTNNVSILIGNGDGSFDAAVDFGAGNAPSSIVAGDFNRDGRLDLAVANGTSNDVSILIGDGAGSFDGALFSSPFAAGTTPSALVAGDFDRDGRLDVAVANLDGDNVSVLLNTAPPPTVIAPAAGEELHILGVATIRWSFGGSPTPPAVNVLLSRDGGATFKAILKKTPNDGIQNWTVTGPATTLNNARIRVCTTAKLPVCATGDAFTISP